jgi:hypothetical protein
MPCAIPGEKISREDQESQHEGESEDLHPNDLLVGGTRLILQEEIIFEQREVWRNP